MNRQAGFVLTLELLLITTILIIGSFAGLASVRDALFKQYVARQAQEPVIVDAQNRRLGKPVDYDEHDAPRIAYIDRNGETPYRTLISVRDDRFTSREPLYYEGSSCTGTPCIKTISDETTDSTGIDGIAGSGSVSYLNALQGGPNFAIGRSDDGVQGFLYREEIASCPVAPDRIGSRWVSQKVVSGAPCETVQFSPNTPANTDCLLDTGDGALCSCPAGFQDQGTIVARYAADTEALFTSTYRELSLLLPVLAPTQPQLGTICCPTGSALNDDNNLSQALVTAATNSILDPIDIPQNVQNQVAKVLRPLGGTLTCNSSASFSAAAQVTHPDNPSANALSTFQSPFRVTLPLSAGDTQWQSIEPDGEAGPDRP